MAEKTGVPFSRATLLRCRQQRFWHDITITGVSGTESRGPIFWGAADADYVLILGVGIVQSVLQACRGEYQQIASLSVRPNDPCCRNADRGDNEEGADGDHKCAGEHVRALPTHSIP
jgi:hypothetical protein